MNLLRDYKVYIPIQVVRRVARGKEKNREDVLLIEEFLRREDVTKHYGISWKFRNVEVRVAFMQLEPCGLRFIGAPTRAKSTHQTYGTQDYFRVFRGLNSF